MCYATRESREDNRVMLFKMRPAHDKFYSILQSNGFKLHKNKVTGVLDSDLTTVKTEYVSGFLSGSTRVNIISCHNAQP